MILYIANPRCQVLA